ncbi:beclin 1-associated autophagy-related key regulator-like [Glandiceps talaboti]
MATCSEDSTKSISKSSDVITVSSGVSIAVERCPLCSNSRRTFSCKNCVEQGNFTHSSGRNPERYAEKLVRLHRMKKERLKLLEKVSKVLEGQVQYNIKKWEVTEVKQKTELLQSAIDDAVRRCEQERLRVKAEQEQRERYEMKIKILQEKIKKALRYIDQSRQHHSKSIDTKERLEDQLCLIRRIRIEELMKSIFRVTEVKEAEPEEEGEAESDNGNGHSLTSSAVVELTEAQHMSYIHGKWVYTGNHSKTQFTIVTPEATLPGDGEYSAYTAWYESTRPASPNSEMSQRNPGNAMSAALSYTTQLLSVLTFYLGVNLPEKLCYSKFCGKELSPKSFSRAVAKLNTNILHVCFTQTVDPECLNPSHTLRNLMICLNPQTSQLGRSGPFEVNAELVQSVEESLVPYYGYSDDSDHDSSGEDDIDFGQDWETVSRQLLDVPTRTSDTYLSTTPSQMTHHDSTPTASANPSTAGGLMSSAAASVASLWRAATSTTGLSSPATPEKKS